LSVSNLNKNLKINNLPNLITSIRLILTIPLIIFLESNNTLFVLIIIIIGGITDYLDGYFARKYELKTKIGAILDPLADKVFIIIPFIWLCKYEVIPFWSLSLLLIREFLISAFRGIKENGLPALKVGKYKTFLQFISLIILFSKFNQFHIQNIGLIIYWISFTLTIVSLFSYLKIK
tara:strand:+ start:557 stop:1087 length:531 start_codon:yes stop_codon:yes gene_type:complete